MSLLPTQADNTDPHLWLIELLAWWQGRVNTRDLRQHFGISRQQSIKYIKRYTQSYPRNLDYSHQAKAYLPTESFCCQLISGDASEYLDWLNQGQSQTRYAGGSLLTNASLSLPKRQIAPEIMRALVTAIRLRQRLEIGYVSLSTPEDEGRVIQPHTFVKTGLRWHLRAYCEKSGEFRDFVLSRFRGEPALSGPATHEKAMDGGWNTWVELVFAPDARLTEAQRQIIEQDYQMQNGQLRLKTRAALAQYLIQEMQVNIKFLAESGEAQQLVLVNKVDIKGWLFDS